MIVEDIEFEFLEKINIMDYKLNLMEYMLRSNNIDIEQYEDCFNVIIDNVNGYINYSRLRPRSFDNKILTWKKVQSTENYEDKFIFAKSVYTKFLSRFNIIKNNTPDINLLVMLGIYLEILTNVNNLYFDLTKSNAYCKVFKSKSKEFNNIFKEDIKFLAYDYRKFLDINKFSEEESIGINQEEGLKLYDIGELIYNFKLEEAMDLLFSSIDSEKIPFFE